VQCPLVLHGGSGLTDDDFRRCIENGICKINIFTDVNQAAVRAAAEAYRPGVGLSELTPLMMEAMREATAKKMILFNSNGKA